MTPEWNLWDDAPAGAGEDGTGDKGKNKAAGAECSGGGAVDPRERHKLAERERRKSMKELFLSLHSLLPHSGTVRKEQSAILDEIIKYIPVAAAARLRALESRSRQRTPSGAAAARTDGSNPQTSSPSSLSSSSSSHNDSGAGGDNAPAPGACRRTSTAPRKRSRSASDGLGGGSSDRNSMEEDCYCEIRVAPEPTTTVAIRVRGDRVNVSLTDARGASAAQAILLSAVLDQLEAHQLDLVRSTHCRDGSKLLHHSESKIREDADRTPGLLKARLQELASKLHGMRKPAAAAAAAAVKRAPPAVDQHGSVEEDLST